MSADPHVLAIKQLQLDPGSDTITWSRNGFVCYATAPHDGHNLKMTFLENTNGTDWRLASPHKVAIKPLEASAVPALHLVQWSSVLTDLAVFDELGNFYILLAGVGLLRSKNGKADDANAPQGSSASGGSAPAAAQNGQSETDGPSYELTSYNHTEMIYRDVAAAPGAGNRCVAFKWLGVEKPQIVNKPARLSGSGYEYGVQLYQSQLLVHPIASKQACVALRLNGVFSVYFQGEHKVEYHKMLVNLAGFFTHASIGYTSDKKIVVCAYDALLLRILSYVVTVHWGFLVESALRQRSDPHFYTPKDKQVAPTVSAELIHEMTPDVGAFADQNNELVDTRLALIDVISPCHQANVLDVLVSYTHTNQNGVCSYTTQRFHVKSAQEVLSEPFASMAADLQPGLASLVFQDKLTVPRAFKAIRTALLDCFVLLVHKDGSVVCVDRATWTVVEAGKVKLENEEMPPTIRSILDCGFTFPQLDVADPSFIFAVSPNMTSVVYGHIGYEAPLKFAVLDRTRYSQNIKLSSVAFSFSHAHACYSNTCSDDLLALIRVETDRNPEIAQQLLQSIIVESHSAINFHLNSFGKDLVDKLLSNPPLQKLLSLQLVLSDLSGAKVSADMAWVVLNLRSTSFGIMFSLSSIYRQISKKKPVYDTLEDSTSRGECIILLIGNVKWLIDLIYYLNQELLQLSFAKSNPADSVITLENSIALPIILSKVPRLFLMYALSSIGKTHEILKKLHKDLSESNKLFKPMKEALERFFLTCSSLPLRLNNFETFLRDCEVYITKEFSQHAPDAAKLLHLEQQMFCNGTIPSELQSAARNIVDRHALSMSRDLKLSELYFYDNSWLDVGVATRAETFTSTVAEDSDLTLVRLRYSSTEAVDALRKIFIDCTPLVTSGGTTSMGQYHSSTNRVRKCVRCRAVSLISDPLVFNSPRSINLWTMVFQRTCICGSAWVNCA